MIYAPVPGHEREGVGVRHLLACGVTADMAIVTESGVQITAQDARPGGPLSLKRRDINGFGSESR